MTSSHSIASSDEYLAHGVPSTSSPSLEDFRIEVVDDASTFAKLRDEWNQLLSSSRSDCLFLTWEWLHTWWINLGQTRRLFIITARLGSELVALAPLTVTRTWIGPLAFPMLEFAGTGSIGSDYLDFIVSSKHEATAVAAVTNFLAETGISLRLPRVRKDSIIATAVDRTLRDRGWGYRNVSMEVCPFIDVSGSWDSYLSGVRRKHRSNFTRSLRNLEKNYAVRLWCTESEEDRRKALAHLVNLHLLRRQKLGGSNAFDNPQLAAFHETLSRLALERGWLRLFVLTLDEKAAAALYCFRYGRNFLYYQSGFDPALQRYGVGQVTVGLTIRRAFEESAAEYDFLHGGETYKFKWSTDVRRLVRLEFFPPGRIGRIQRNTVHAVAAAKKLVKQVLRRPAARGALEAQD